MELLLVLLLGPRGSEREEHGEAAREPPPGSLPLCCMRCSGAFVCLMDQLLREAAGIGKLVGPGSGLVSFDQTCCDGHCRCS